MAGSCNLKDAYGLVKGGEIFWLIEPSSISPYSHGNYANHEPLRTRKLLMHRSEISKLIGRTTERGLTLVPLRVYLKDGSAEMRAGSWPRAGRRFTTNVRCRSRRPSTRKPVRPSARDDNDAERFAYLSRQSHLAQRHAVCRPASFQHRRHVGRLGEIRRIYRANGRRNVRGQGANRILERTRQSPGFSKRTACFLQGSPVLDNFAKPSLPEGIQGRIVRNRNTSPTIP